MVLLLLSVFVPVRAAAGPVSVAFLEIVNSSVDPRYDYLEGIIRGILLYDLSTISLKDETPGSIALYSHLIDAEIFLNDEFIGYTTGNARVPFLIENLYPGNHLVRIQLHSFGVIQQPEIIFKDWQEEVQVKAGKQHVVRAKAYHFNEQLYNLTKLLREDINIRSIKEDKTVIRRHEVSFINRQGEEVTILLDLKAAAGDEKIDIEAVLTYQGEAFTFMVSVKEGERKEFKQEVGLVEFEIDIDRSELSYDIWRRDIRQNMFRE